jgi:hypothetical protein
MATFRRGIPILDSSREGKLWRRDRCHRPAACFSPNLNYAALLQKGAPSGSKAKSTSGCTPILMKFLETLAAARPLSLFLVAVIVLSVGITALCVGFAVHIAGPVTIHIPHIELPAVEIHTGSAPASAEPSNNVMPRPRQSTTK